MADISDAKSSENSDAPVGKSLEDEAADLFRCGAQFEKEGRMDEAVGFYRRALRLVPDIEQKLDKLAEEAHQEESMKAVNEWEFSRPVPSECVPAEPSEHIQFYLRDISRALVEAWRVAFADCSDVTVSHGDIFKGAPAADAIVSPANSFGFMDGGIDMVYSRFFGWQMQTRLQAKLQEEMDGELPVGQAVIIPSVLPGSDEEKKVLASGCNEGKLIPYLISAPTMRVPYDVADTANAYLAFRAIIRAILSHNSFCRLSGEGTVIRSVLCPGLGTAVGRMPFIQCALQMRTAYDASYRKDCRAINHPRDLFEAASSHYELTMTGSGKATTYGKAPEPGELFLPKK